MGADGEIVQSSKASRRVDTIRLRARGGGVVAVGDLAENLPGDVPRLFRLHPSVSADDEPAVGGLAPAVAGPVVDDFGAHTRGLDADAEAREPVVPAMKGLSPGTRSSTLRLLRVICRRVVRLQVGADIVRFLQESVEMSSQWSTRKWQWEAFPWRSRHGMAAR